MIAGASVQFTNGSVESADSGQPINGSCNRLTLGVRPSHAAIDIFHLSKMKFKSSLIIQTCRHAYKAYKAEPETFFMGRNELTDPGGRRVKSSSYETVAMVDSRKYFINVCFRHQVVIRR